MIWGEKKGDWGREKTSETFGKLLILLKTFELLSLRLLMARRREHAKVDRLIAAGATPGKLRTSEGLVLAAGRERIRMVQDDGAVTAAGRYWEQKTGEQLPAGGFLQQVAQRENNTEYILLRSGVKAVTRTFDEATGAYRFSRLGRRYYSTLRRNYVASVPVKVEGTRKDRSTYEYKAHISVEKLGLRPKQLPLSMRSPERYARVKELIQQELPTNGVLYEVSEEKWTLDPRGSWKVSEETVGTHPDTGEAEAHVVLDRLVGTLPLAPSTMLFPEHVCKEAFEEHPDNLCAPRQIAAVLKLSFDEVCEELLEAGARLSSSVSLELGCTSRTILEFCKARGLGAAIVHNEQVIETLPGKPVLAWTVHEGHCYFYSSAQVRKTLQQRRVGAVTKLRKAQAASKVPLASEWKEWTGEIADGHFFAPEDELMIIRAWFLGCGKNPKVLMKDEARPRALVFHIPKRAHGGPAGTCYIHGVPEHWRAIEAWAARLGLEYRGEGLPATALKALQHLVKRNRERVWLTGEEKAELLEEYGHRCAACGAASSQLEWDHVARLSDCFGAAQAFQPLCSACHREKTDTESRSLDTEILASSFSLSVWQQYVQSPRPPPLVFRMRALPEDLRGFEIADVQRCRKRALELSAHELPMFCVLDDIAQRAEPVLGDLNFVTAKYRHCVHQLGYTGPGWQHRVQTEFLLQHGVISWADVSHTLTATGRYPADLLQAPLREMEAAWEGSSLAKLAVNSLIGLLSIDETRSFKLRSSRHDADAPAGAAKFVFHYGDGDRLYDFVSSELLVTNTSTRPLHELSLCCEATRVGQMLYCLKQCRALPYELKTDSCMYRPQKRRKVDLVGLRYCDLSQLRDKHEPAEHMRRLDEHCSMEQNTSTATVFRCASALDSDRMKSDPRLPSRCSDPPTPPQPWRDLDETAAEERVMRGESLLVLGIAGTGKTTYVQGIVERLRKDGKSVAVISKTHAASKRAGGTTADHWVRRHVLHGTATCDVLWIDEISQLDIGLLNQIAKLSFTGIRFLLSGDFHQFAPISNYWRGTPISEAALECSGLLLTLSGGNRCTLTQCRRGDKKLFNFYSSLIPGGTRFELPLHEAVKQAKAAFRHDGQARWNLCVSHRKRIEINTKMNSCLAPREGAVFLEVAGRPARGNRQQSMVLWPTIELLGCVAAEKKGIRNGCLYVVESIDAAAETLKLQGLSDAISFEQAKAWLRLSYAQTYASCQGTEFSGSLRLHDCASRFFTRRHLFVGLSRACQDAAVSLRD